MLFCRDEVSSLCDDPSHLRDKMLKMGGMIPKKASIPF